MRNCYPPYWATGITVKHISPDFREIVVQMKMRWYNRNYVKPLQDLLRASNHRYLEFISQIDTPSAGVKALEKITRSFAHNQHRYKGFNPLHNEDASIFRILARGEFATHGITCRNLRKHLPHKSPSQVSRMLKRLRVHGILKKVGSAYKYYLTVIGLRLVAAVLKLREQFIIPQLAWGHLA